MRGPYPGENCVICLKSANNGETVGYIRIKGKTEFVHMRCYDALPKHGEVKPNDRKQ